MVVKESVCIRLRLRLVTSQGPRSLPPGRRVSYRPLARRVSTAFFFPRELRGAPVSRGVTNITKVRLDERFATSKAIEKDDDDDSDEELYFKYEEDQPPARSSSSSSTNTWNTTSRLVAGSRRVPSGRVLALY